MLGIFIAETNAMSCMSGLRPEGIILYHWLHDCRRRSLLLEIWDYIFLFFKIMIACPFDNTALPGCGKVSSVNQFGGCP